MDVWQRLVEVPAAPRRADALLVGGIGLWAGLEAVFLGGPGTTAERLGVAVAVSVPLLWRRRFPAAVLLVVSAVLLLRALGGGPPEEGSTPLASLLVAVFSCGLRARAPLAVASLPVPLAAVSSATALDYYTGEPAPADYAVFAFLTVLAWSGGWLLRRRAEAARAALAATDERARTSVRAAVAGERERIARELHDVVAHSLSVVTVQAGAAQSLLRTDPDRAEHHIDAVRRTSRQALVEMRRLLDVLHQPPVDGEPAPDLDQVPALVEEHRASGLPVTLVEDGVRPALAAGLGLASYRIVQEALTNVRKHAGDVATDVRLGYDAERMTIEVSNDLPGRPRESVGSGHGLTGMRERARLHGGTVEVGVVGNRFRVRVVLPVEAPPS
ncbi:sensor histidine kinase [Nocardioides sp. SYSU D00038]|uniref:sensor histidine kinase n=1 Tax=Nocardioides sp. SYSU D00038 TaxID=2812554 RepID=UPI001967EE4B|nr:histidine kinase [Nocardioides sp. SYSU D00038]